MIDNSVGFFHNKIPINARVYLSNGESRDLVIATDDAMIDEDGLVRAFTVRWSDGVVTHYKLAPRHWSKHRLVAFLTEFLAGFLLTRGISGLLRGGREVDHLTRYTLGTSGRNAMHSFSKQEYDHGDCGYYNIETHELVFPGGGLTVSAEAW